MAEVELMTRERAELIDITGMVKDAVRKSGVQDGVCIISTKHTTTSVIVNEDESGLRSDILGFLSGLVPKGAGYSHDRIDDNADAHLKAVLLGCSESIPIVGGDLALGRWQSVFFAEFDGPRKRNVGITILGQK